MSAKNGTGPVGILAGARNGQPPEVEGYEIVGPVGKGGMGEVYAAWQVALPRLVALKFLVPEGIAGPTEAHLARFRHEAELMAKVCHPNILSLFAYGEAGGRPYLVMEYIEGGDLRRKMVPGVPLSADAVRAVVRPVAEALAYLHRVGIVHRDLKPENILLHHGDTPLVTDFGVAVLRENTNTASVPSQSETGRGVGTLGYVAPEQHYRLRVDERVDQYSLAAMTYEMLTGQLPLGVFKAPSRLNAALGPAVDAAILRALQESPKERFESVTAFAEALDRALDQPPPVVPRPGPRRWGPSGLPFGVAALAVLLLLAAGLSQAPWPPRPGPAPPAAAPVVANVPATVDPQDPLTEAIKSVLAKKLWIEQGSPKGVPGDATSEKNWREAGEIADAAVKKLAYQIWKKNHRPEDKALELKFWKIAQRRYYKLMTGQDFLK